MIKTSGKKQTEQKHISARLKPTDKKEQHQKNKPYFLGATKKQLIGYSITGILGVLIIFGVIIPTMQGSLHFLVVLSGSMEPSISPGDVVVTRAADLEDIGIDDIITFKQPSTSDPNRCVTHRVINVTYENDVLFFQTKGDANEDPDINLIDSDDLIGRVVLTIPYLGYLPNFARQPIGFIILIVIPGSLIIINEIYSISKSRKKESEKEPGK